MKIFIFKEQFSHNKLIVTSHTEIEAIPKHLILNCMSW